MLAVDPPKTEISSPGDLLKAGLVANEIAAKNAFADYRSRKAINTIVRQDGDLALFAEFLRSMNLTPGELATQPKAWRGITWGLVQGFVRWQLAQGYAVSSINIRLSTVKAYARLAAKAGALDITEMTLIRSVQGYSHKETKTIDEQRQDVEVPTRKGYKKSNAVSL